jgi:sulfite reductase (NADPH) hemoprotein beta-component
VPWQQILVYIEAVVRVYNLQGRRDNLYKARIKILVKAQGQHFVDDVNAEFAALLADDLQSGAHLIPQAELDRVSACFGAPPLRAPGFAPAADADMPQAFSRWLLRNMQPHKVAGYRAVTLSLKRAGLPPGDVTAAQMEGAAALAEQFSRGELRVTHDQNLLLPWVHEAELRALWQAAKAGGFATPNIGLLTDMIACPGACTTSATSTCTSVAASIPAATITAVTSASWVSTRTAASGTR